MLTQKLTGLLMAIAIFLKIRNFFQLHFDPPQLLTFLALFSATILGLLWHSNLGLHTLFNLNGLINWRTIWYPIPPIAVGWFVATLISFRQIGRRI